jgi:hypothetical protein
VGTFAIPPWLEGRIAGAPFPSRKNLVFRVNWEGSVRVAKVFSEEFRERAKTEYEVLGLCKDARISAPRPLLLKGDVIVMTSLRGRPAFELLQGVSERNPSSGTTNNGRQAFHSIPKPTAAILDGIAGWLARFHGAFRWERVRGDSISKNFMCSSTGVAGFDFEESVPGDPVADVGQFCAHLLASGERFSSPLFGAAGYFTSRYWRHSGRDRSAELPAAVSDGLRHYARFRRDGALLRSWAGRITKDGLGRI